MFNGTFDSAENRWKALQTQGMYRAQKFAENLYYHELCKGLKSLGYEIQNGPRHFEIKGVPQSVVTKFSKRHQQIDEESKKKVAENERPVDLYAIRRQVVRDDRKRKIKDSTASKLRPLWAKQLTREDRAALESLRQTKANIIEGPSVTASLMWAEKRAVRIPVN